MILKNLGVSTITSLLAAALVALLTVTSPVHADESPAVDLEKAKAELAKAKQKDDDEPRKRLFFRKSDSDKEKEEKVEKRSEEKPKEPRRRLFKRDKKEKEREREKEKEKEKAPEKSAAVVEKKESKKDASPKEEKARGLKRFSPFGKEDSDDKKSESKPPVKNAAKEEKKTASKKSDDADEKRGFLGGIFKGDSDKKKVAKVADKPKPTKAKEESNDSDSGSSLFRMFAKNDSKEYSKAEKTKLGKSIESKPAKPAGGAVAKKSSTSGELGWYVITEAKAPFYAVGPGQPMPPEKQLDRGSMLTVTKGGWGWCNVKLGSGELGVVSAKAMRPATIAEVSRHTRPVATASKSTGSRRLFNILSRGPAPKLDLPTRSSEAPIRNFGLLPSLAPAE